MNWDYKGVFPTGTEDTAAVFYGSRGIISFCGNPLPAGSVSPMTAARFTDDGITLETISVNTLAHQWQELIDGDWKDMEGQNRNELSLFFKHEDGVAGIHTYRCQCIGLAGNTYSNEATITVTYRVPSVRARINKTKLTPSDTLKLIVEETAYNDTLVFQELISTNWEDITENLTGNIHEITFVHGEDMGSTHSYRAKVTGLGGEIYSDVLTCVVSYPAPEFSSIAASEPTVHLVDETSASTTITAAYTNADHGIKWQTYNSEKDDWDTITGETEDTLTLTYEYGTPRKYFYYRCVASGYGGVVVSDTISIGITYRVPTAGITAALSEDRTKYIITATPQYADHGIKWQELINESWNTIAGETANTLEIDLFAGMPAGTHYYRYMASGYGGEVASNQVAVTISYQAPTASIMSSYTTVTAPASVLFGVTATHAHIGVQWEHSTDKTTWAAISGGTGKELTVNYTTSDRGTHYYRCTATGYGGSTASNVVEITVQ